jgi:uncharacterized membrane protein YhhN
MTATAAAALGLAAVAALANWVAVARGANPVEYVAKPATMAALVVVAVALEPFDDARRWWFVAAAVFSLAGDVFLMLPRDRFIPGLVSFLVAHLCYVAGMVALPAVAGRAVLGLLLVAAAVATVGMRVLRAVRAGAHRALFGPVLGYLVVISAMVVAAFATGPPLAIAGAVTFYASDSILAEQRFVRTHAWAPVAVMVTYHLGQAALILSLVVR